MIGSFRMDKMNNTNGVKIKRGTLLEEFLYQFFLLKSLVFVKRLLPHEAKLMNPQWHKAIEEITNALLFFRQKRSVSYAQPFCGKPKPCARWRLPFVRESRVYSFFFSLRVGKSFS